MKFRAFSSAARLGLFRSSAGGDWMTGKVIHDIFMDQAVQNPQARALPCRGMDPTSYQYTPYTRREITAAITT